VTTHHEDARAHWEAALADLERTLDETAEVLAGGATDSVLESTWTPPDLPGPMPRDLAARAHKLLTRQREQLAQARTAAADVRQNLSLLDKLTGKSAQPTAVYVDLRA
jgi:hypothetical protein